MYQRKSSKLCLESYGEKSQQYLMRLAEQIQMQMNAQCRPSEYIDVAKRAAELANEVFKAPED